jgi:hypothetical protein
MRRNRVFIWLAMSVLPLGCGQAADSEPGEDVAVTEDALEATCLTWSRGSAFQNVTVEDTTLASNTPSTPAGSASLTTGLIAGAQRVVLYETKLPSIPANATVLSASLTLRLRTSADVGIRAHRVTAPWTEATATWNSAASSYDPAVAAATTTGVAGSAAAPVSFDLTALAQGWVDGSLANDGVLIEQDLVGSSTSFSSEDGTLNRRPRFDLCYVVPSCSDGAQNQGETGLDCGGPCAACPTCNDGLQNQGETGVDCGGPSCAACPTCNDGLQNQGESGLDCGGPCAACATCTDGIQNQGETGVDCGGPSCAACPYAHTITIDGQNDFSSSADKFPTTTAGFNGYASWDASNLYLGMSGNDVQSNSATKWVLVYLGGPGGTTTGVNYNTQTPGLPFSAKYHIRWRTDNAYTNTQLWNGGAWVDAGWSWAGNIFQSGNFVEMRIPRSLLGDPSTVNVVMEMINEQGFQEWSFSGFPSNTFLDGYDRDFAKYFGFDFSLPNTPSGYAPL